MPWQSISIHAPREGSDKRSKEDAMALDHFYPRSPRGERLTTGLTVGTSVVFLSTLPARGATAALALGRAAAAIFLSTLPARGATGLSHCRTP